jgi:hypothetical protein
LGVGNEEILPPSFCSVACSAAMLCVILPFFGGELLLIGGKLLDCLAYNGEIKCYRLELLCQLRRT